jgi:hypothetical protein
MLLCLFSKTRQAVSMSQWALHSARYHKLCSDAILTRVQSEQNMIAYSVVILQNHHDSRLKKKQQVSPLEFSNIYNKDYILHFMTK